MGLYRSVGRPLLFTLPPEASHSLAAGLLKLPLPWSMIGGAVDSTELETDLAGIRLRNPVGLAAGFDKNASMVDGMARLGFGYVVVGTISLRPRDGNPKPRIVRTPREGSITNAMGIPNEGVGRVAGHLRARRSTVPVIASLADEDPADVVAVHSRLRGLVQGFELNVSSPNSPWRHSGRNNASHLKEVLAALADRREEPLFVKLPPFRTEEERASVLELATIAAEADVDGLTCSNTRPVKDARLPNGRGGLSGRPLTGDTPRIVAEIRRATGGFVPINGCGGIFTAADVGACLEAGATTVQVYTSLIYRGPRLVRELTSGLAVASSAPRGED